MQKQSKILKNQTLFNDTITNAAVQADPPVFVSFFMRTLKNKKGLVHQRTR